jgi:hypothetical protein
MLDSHADTMDFVAEKPGSHDQQVSRPMTYVDAVRVNIDEPAPRVPAPVEMSAIDLGRHPELHRSLFHQQPRVIAPTTTVSLAMTNEGMSAMMTSDSINTQMRMYYEKKLVPEYAQLDFEFMEMVVRTTAATLHSHGCLVTASGTLVYVLATILTFIFLPMQSVMCLIRGQGCSRAYWHGPPSQYRLRGGVSLSGMEGYEALSDEDIQAEQQPGEANVVAIASAQGEAAAAGTSAQPAPVMSTPVPVPAPVVVQPVASPGSQSGTAALAAINKHLAKAIQVPTTDSWDAMHPTTWCIAMDRYLAVTGITEDYDSVVKLIWTVLPPAVRLAVVPRASTLSYRGANAGMWDGLETFPTWSALRAAILAHFLPLAQEKHVTALFELQFKPGTGLQFRDKFLQHCAMLDAAFMPNDAQLLRHLKAAQYPRLASVASVFMHGNSRWLPAQWSALLDAMVDADVVLAETQSVKVAGAQPVSDPAPSRAPSGPAKGRKRKQPRTGDPSPAPKRQASGASKGAGPSNSTTKSAGNPARDRFQAFRWADPAVQAAAKEGKCINCLQKGHFARECPQPKVVRARVPDAKGKGPSKNV